MSNDELVKQIEDMFVSFLGAPIAEIGAQAIGAHAADEVRELLLAIAPSYAAMLLDESEPDLGRESAEMILRNVWRGEPPAEWWSTDLGRICAKHLISSRYGLAELTYSEAAAMLGVSRSRVLQLIHAGQLERGERKITRSSVLARIADPRAQMFRQAHELSHPADMSAAEAIAYAAEGEEQ